MDRMRGFLANLTIVKALRILCHVSGVIMVTFGISLIYVPAGCIAAGIFLWLEAHGSEFTSTRREEGR